MWSYSFKHLRSHSGEGFWAVPCRKFGMEALRLQARPSVLREPIVEPAQVCHLSSRFPGRSRIEERGWLKANRKAESACAGKVIFRANAWTELKSYFLNAKYCTASCADNAFNRQLVDNAS